MDMVNQTIMAAYSWSHD